jgi:PAS domain S-box-containing protein
VTAVLRQHLTPTVESPVNSAFSTDRGVQLAFVSALAILLLVGALSYRSMAVSSESDRWVKHSYEVSSNLDNMLSAMTSVEANGRGFQLTGDESYLDSRRASVSDLERRAAVMRRITNDNPREQARMLTIDALINQRIQFGDKIISLRQTQGLDAAVQGLRDAGGRRMADEFHEIVQQMQEEEAGLLAQRASDTAVRLHQTGIVLVLGTVLGLLITASAGIGVLRDGNRRRRAEAALRESEDQSRTLLNEVQDYAILMLDLKGRVVTWNAGAERFQGYDARQIIGENFSRFFAQDDDVPDRPAEILRLAALNGRHEEQCMRVRKDGSQFVASITYTALRDAAGQLRGFSEITRDLSESKESEAKFRGLLEAAPDAMVVVNERGEIVLLNLQAEKQFGYHRDELLGQSVSNIVPHGFAERLVADGLRSAEDALAQQIGTGIELTARRKDGSEFPIEIMLSPLESADGVLVTAAIRDITARRKGEAELLEKVQELNRSNEELQQFAYLASHDLQEPLRMVASYTALLARRYKGKLDSDADDFIAFAVEGASRMERLIQDLLAYSRVGSKGKELVNTSSEGALQRAIGNLRGAIEASGALVTHERLPFVMADEMQLTQLFQNLVGNAIKYRRAGVSEVHIAAVPNGANKWMFSVQDNGLGIESQYFERIFGMFQRLHKREEFDGTGIGLAICKKIVERHGGTISVKSTIGEGSTFSFPLVASSGN